jgi:hypothetical protein
MAVPRKQAPQAPWRSVIETPVHPYTSADFQAIANALRISQTQLLTLHVSFPGVTVVGRGARHTFPLNVALEKAAKSYFAFIYDIDKHLGLHTGRRPSKPWTGLIRDWQAALHQFVILCSERVSV